VPRRVIVAVLLLALAAGCGEHGAGGAATVQHVIDGDTIVLADGRHVRLVQLDAPEAVEHECYGNEATHVLETLLRPGTQVEIEQDPALDQQDVYGRTLAYVFADGKNVNLELVRRGAAAPWFYDGDRGRYATALLGVARKAQAQRRGLWGACPATVLDPLHPVTALP
jgi:micrococcal nuclease